MARYWVGGTASWDATAGTKWALTDGGAGGQAVPTAADDVYFTAASGAVTVTQGAAYAALCKTLTCTGFTGTLSGNSSYIKVSGTVVLAAGMTATTLYIWTLAAGNLTTAGKTLTGAILTTTTLQDALVVSGVLSIASGTTNANNQNVTAASVKIEGFSISPAITMGSGTWTLTGSGTVWNSTSATITANTSTIKLTDATSTAKTFVGAGSTYNNIWLTGAGTGEFQFTGSNTFNDFKCDTPPHTIKFTAGTTTTVTTFTVSGTAGNLITIGSLTASAHTLTKSGGGVIDRDYLSISQSTASPASTWYAGMNSTNGGNITGWNFGTSTTVLNAGLFINSGP